MRFDEMKPTFQLVVPGLLWPTADFARPNEKLATLNAAGVPAIAAHYQTAEKPVGTPDEWGEEIFKAISYYQSMTGTVGIVFASSVGAAATLRAAQLLEERGFPLPHIVFVGPVPDTAATIDKRMPGESEKLMQGDIDTIKVPVSVPEGHQREFYPVDKAHYESAVAMRGVKLKGKFPSVTVLTSSNDIYCSPTEAQALINNLPAECRFIPTIWEGGHNDTGSDRDTDIISAIRKVIALEDGFDIYRHADQIHNATLLVLGKSFPDIGMGSDWRVEQLIAARNQGIRPGLDGILPRDPVLG